MRARLLACVWYAPKGKLGPPVECAANHIERSADNVSQEGDKGIGGWRRISVRATLTATVANAATGRSDTTRSDIASCLRRAGLLGWMDAAVQHVLWHCDWSDETAVEWERSAAISRRSEVYCRQLRVRVTHTGHLLRARKSSWRDERWEAPGYRNEPGARAPTS